jgi:hypothetical protein
LTGVVPLGISPAAGLGVARCEPVRPHPYSGHLLDVVHPLMFCVLFFGVPNGTVTEMM